MAKHLARIHGTEEDKVNCPFYFKIGACRHGDRCSRLHHKPAFSPTVLLKHLYHHPAAPNAPPSADPREDFLVFYEDVFLELSKYGTISELHVVDNQSDHMIGHTYVLYESEEQAADALEDLMNPQHNNGIGRTYDGTPIVAEYSPVTDFREARCRDYDEGSCARSGFCNFLHSKYVPIPLIRDLQDEAAERRRKKRIQQEEEAAEAAEKEERERKKRKKHDSKREKQHRHRKSSSNKRSRRSRSSSRSPSPSRYSDDDHGDDRGHESS
jgi:splicing factor U2AF subunit